MGTKTILIMEDAYEILKRNKAEGESFSDVIRRLAIRRGSIMEFAGVLKRISPEKIKLIKETVEELRKPSEREKEMFR